MNKQELIDKYNTKKANLRPYCPNRIQSVEELKSGIYTEFIDDLKQLDEPQKLIVPQCFDIDYKKYKYMENNKSEILLTAMGGIYRTAFSGFFRDLSSDVWKTGIKWNKWTKETILWASRNYADFCQAVISGDYEVEKGPLWVVAVHSGEYYFTRFMSNHNPEDRFPWDSIMDKDKGYHFTDKEKADAVALLIGGTVEVVAEG